MFQGEILMFRRTFVLHRANEYRLHRATCYLKFLHPIQQQETRFERNFILFSVAKLVTHKRPGKWAKTSYFQKQKVYNHNIV